MHTDILYIASAETLPAKPAIQEKCSILCIGYLPFSYNLDNIEILCVAPKYTAEDLLQKVMNIFDQFYCVEDEMNQALLCDDPFEKIGNILFRLFQNPLQAMTFSDKFLFVEFDPERSEFLERYQQYAASEYVPLEERLIIRSDPDFSGIFLRPGVFFSEVPSAMYGVPVLMYNFFFHNWSYGYMYIEEVYRKIRDSDYMLLEWAGSYLMRLLRKDNLFLNHFPEDVHSLITDLAIKRFP